MTLVWVAAKIFMTTIKHTSKTVFEKLIQPISGLIDNCNYQRNCKTLSDQQWIETGLLRTICKESSGREFLQRLIDSGRSVIKRSHFFETLKSKRRLNLCREVSSALYHKLSDNKYISDPFSQFTELNDYDIYAGDGHYHSAAAHDIRKGGKKYPTLHFYSVNLRTNGLNHLTLADTSGGRKKEHDMRALKRLDINTLRQGSPKGRKVLYVWDRAGIDFRQWFNWKHSSGIYFISREKKNMDLQTMGYITYDSEDTINKGVESFTLAGTSTGVIVNKIEFKCPISGERFNFITNLLNVPPGLVAYIYKTRWNIEKIFDQVKNKLNEKKAWASTDTAKTMQAQFVCMTHNLMLILDKQLEIAGLQNQIENKRREKRLNKTILKSKLNKDELPIFLTTPKRPVLRSVKFIRWLRNNLFSSTSWREALLSLKLVYDVF